MPTVTGLRISSVNGTALLDNCPADIIAAVGIGAQIKIYDASSRYLQGVIDVAGSSETLGSNLLDSLNLASGWTPYGATITSANSFTNTGVNNGFVYKTPFGAAERLLKTELTSTVSIGGAVDCQDTNGGLAVRYAVSGAGATYKTQNINWVGFVNYSGGLGNLTTITSINMQQVTAPSSSGVIIKDLSGNQNFISKDANFTYNAASYTYEIITGLGKIFKSSIFESTIFGS